MIKDLVLKNRSYRRWYQDVPVEKKTLRELVDLARNSASATNRQPLKYILSCDPEKNARIFPLIGFASQLRDWPGPLGRGAAISLYHYFAGYRDSQASRLRPRHRCPEHSAWGDREGAGGLYARFGKETRDDESAEYTRKI